MTIPKVIHYCWFGGNPLPELAQKCIASWQKHMPDYEIKQWNEANFDINRCNCSYIKEAYDAGKWAFVSDYVRFYLLYNYGGVYFDTDVELIRPINNILDIGPYMGMEKTSQSKRILVNPGLGIAAPAGLEIYKKIIEYYNEQHFIDVNGNIDQTTVVHRVTSLLKEYEWDDVGNNIIKVKNIYVYPSEYFCPMDYFSGQINISSKTYSIHHYVASWMSQDDKKNTEIFNHYKKKYGNKIGKMIAYIRTYKLRKKKYGIIKALYKKYS